MRAHFRLIALAVGLLVPPMFVAGPATAQTQLNPTPANQSAHDAALEATRRGDYVAALDLSKKAAAEGQPLDADQVDFISGKAARQQAAADDAARLKTSQQAAAATAEQIQARQQKDYAARAKQQQDQCPASEPSHIGVFTSAAGAAGSQGNDKLGGKRITGAEDTRCGG